MTRSLLLSAAILGVLAGSAMAQQPYQLGIDNDDDYNDYIIVNQYVVQKVYVGESAPAAGVTSSYNYSSGGYSSSNLDFNFKWGPACRREGNVTYCQGF